MKTTSTSSLPLGSSTLPLLQDTKMPMNTRVGGRGQHTIACIIVGVNYHKLAIWKCKPITRLAYRFNLSHHHPTLVMPNVGESSWKIIYKLNGSIQKDLNNLGTTSFEPISVNCNHNGLSWYHRSPFPAATSGRSVLESQSGSSTLHAYALDKGIGWCFRSKWPECRILFSTCISRRIYAHRGNSNQQIRAFPRLQSVQNIF